MGCEILLSFSVCGVGAEDNKESWGRQQKAVYTVVVVIALQYFSQQPNIFLFFKTQAQNTFTDIINNHNLNTSQGSKSLGQGHKDPST